IVYRNYMILALSRTFYYFDNNFHFHFCQRQTKLYEDDRLQNLSQWILLFYSDQMTFQNLQPLLPYELQSVYQNSLYDSSSISENWNSILSHFPSDFHPNPSRSNSSLIYRYSHCFLDNQPPLAQYMITLLLVHKLI